MKNNRSISTKARKRSKSSNLVPSSPQQDVKSMAEHRRDRQALIGEFFGMDMEKNTFFMMMKYLFTSEVRTLCSYPTLMKECASSPEMANYIDFAWLRAQIIDGRYRAEQWCVCIAKYSSPNVLKSFYNAIVNALGPCHTDDLHNPHLCGFYFNMAAIFCISRETAKCSEFMKHPISGLFLRIALNDKRRITTLESEFDRCMHMAILFGRVQIVKTMKRTRTVYFSTSLYKFAIDCGDEFIISAYLGRYAESLYWGLPVAISNNRVCDVGLLLDGIQPHVAGIQLDTIVKDAIRTAIEHKKKDILSYLFSRHDATRHFRFDTYEFRESLDSVLSTGNTDIWDLVVYHTTLVPVEMLSFAIQSGCVEMAKLCAPLTSMDDAHEFSIWKSFQDTTEEMFRIFLTPDFRHLCISPTILLRYFIKCKSWTQQFHIELVERGATLPHDALVIAFHSGSKEAALFLLQTYTFSPDVIRYAFWNAIEGQNCSSTLYFAEAILSKYKSIILDADFCTEMVRRFILLRYKTAGEFLLDIVSNKIKHE